MKISLFSKRPPCFVRLFSLIWTGLATLVGAVSPAYAIPVIPLALGTSEVKCEATSVVGGVTTQEISPLSASGHFSCNSPLSRSQVGASLHTLIAAGSASGSSQEEPFGFSSGSATGTLDWLGVASPKGIDLPREIVEIPSVFIAEADASRESTNNGVAAAQAFVDLKDDRTDKLIFHVFAGVNSFGPGKDHASIREKVNLKPGRIVNIHAEGTCQGNSGTLGTFECFARADPTFTFDQEAFDAINAAQGLPSFQLADFFEFQFSPT
jgi:hypothetical protein